MIIGIPLRKYVAANPRELRKLLDGAFIQMNFTKCVGTFLGFRFLGHLNMDPLQTGFYNTALAFSQEASPDLDFDNEVLPKIKFPFDQSPAPLPDFINFHKNQQIEVCSFDSFFFFFLFLFPHDHFFLSHPRRS